MAAPKILMDVFEEHLEEFEFLWPQRQRALWSPSYTIRELAELDGRIECHVHGLLAADEDLPDLVAAALEADEPLLAFRSAYLMLRMKSDAATDRVLEAVLTAQGGKLEGLKQALCHGIFPVERLRSATSSPGPVKLAIATLLACKGKLDLKVMPLEPFFKDSSPAIRIAAWRTAALCNEPIAPQAFRAALSDPEPDVVAAVLHAAAWQRQPWLLDECRKIAVAPGQNAQHALHLLAILGGPADAEILKSSAMNPKLGLERFQSLGSYGNPLLMEALFEGMADKNPLAAAAAGNAFTKITGLKIPSNKRTTMPPENGKKPDEFEKEFLEEVNLPDCDLAREHCKRIAAQYRQGTRWCRGLNLSQGTPPPDLQQLDLESRWEACLRGKFEGTWKGSPFELEVFPQRSNV